MDLHKVIDVDMFKRDVAADVSCALGPEAKHVKVVGLRAGSIIVDLEVTPQPRSSGRDIEHMLVEQARDPTSALMTGKYTAKTAAVSPPKPGVEPEKERTRAAGRDVSPAGGLDDSAHGDDGDGRAVVGRGGPPELVELEALLRRDPFSDMVSGVGGGCGGGEGR